MYLLLNIIDFSVGRAAPSIMDQCGQVLIEEIQRLERNWIAESWIGYFLWIEA